jgi:pimeloyl-ACP methyl ester carboxylesterase
MAASLRGDQLAPLAQVRSVELQTPDGRSLELVVAGPSGMPLVLHHGTPGAAVVFDRLVDTAGRHGLRTVVYARPGYGRSAPRPGRSVADAAADVTVVLDALGAAEFVTVGWSGGGPHALAAAALLPDRCRGAATIAGVASGLRCGPGGDHRGLRRVPGRTRPRPLAGR